MGAFGFTAFTWLLENLLYFCAKVTKMWQCGNWTETNKQGHGLKYKTMIRKGDSVRFLNAVGGGVVVRIDEIKKLVEESITSTSAKEIKDMGKVMADLSPKIKGRADGGQVSKIVKELLAK